MKKTFLLNISIFFLAVAPCTVFSQYTTEYGGSLGVSNYLGDIGGGANTRRDFISDMKMAKTRYNISGFVRKRLRREVYLKADLSYLRIQGDDALTSNPARHYRNFNFRNDLIELDVTGEWMFYENTDLGASYRFRNAFRAYIFAGVGVFYHSPKTFYDGEWVALRPLMTEGESKPYKKFVMAIPVGIGFHYTMKKRHRFGMEMNWRTTFTDYLDDIHANYPDPTKVSTATKDVTFRTDVTAANTYQQGFANNYDGIPSQGKDGSVYIDKRGQGNHNDSFITLSVSYSYVMRGKSSFYRSRYGSFFRKKGRKVVRRIRSKF